jgi:hypothetical protein
MFKFSTGRNFFVLRRSQLLLNAFELFIESQLLVIGQLVDDWLPRGVEVVLDLLYSLSPIASVILIPTKEPLVLVSDLDLSNIWCDISKYLSFRVYIILSVCLNYILVLWPLIMLIE